MAAKKQQLMNKAAAGPQKPDGRMPQPPADMNAPPTTANPMAPMAPSNQMLADGGMVGAVPALNNTHCTGAAYDQGGRDAGKKR